MSSQTGKKERIHYFDIMKGILILMVIIGHTNSIETLTSTELKQFPFHLTQYVSCNLFTPHFMAGFFLVTGYCSNFQKRISEQIVTDFRRLIVPAFIINALMNCISGINTITFRSIVVLPWFIIALFVAKLMVKVTIENMTSNVAKIIFFVIIGFIGCLIWGTFWWLNLSSIPHAMAFAFFIYLGYLYRIKELKPSIMGVAISAVCYLCLMVFYNIVLERDLPALCALITFPWYMYPIYIVTAIAGSYIIFFISYRISKNSVLESIGRNSLILYLTHGTFFSLVSKCIIFFEIDINQNALVSLIILLIMVIASIFWGHLWAIILSLRYTKWIMGK